jgi:hypothetical protein
MTTPIKTMRGSFVFRTDFKAATSKVTVLDEMRSNPSASTSWRMVNPSSARSLAAFLGRRFNAMKNSVMPSRVKVDTGTPLALTEVDPGFAHRS